MNRDASFLRDILDMIEGIERHAGPGQEAFEQDEVLQGFLLRQLQNIGEASSQLTADLRAAHPEVPWRDIIAMRNALVHHYFGIHLDEVRAAVENDVPELKRQVEAILASVAPGSGPPADGSSP